MEGKDNRSLGKRHAMRQLKNKRIQRTGNGQNTASSSTPPLRGIADVADSSDDRLAQRDGRWGSRQQNRDFNLDELDMLDDSEDTQQAQMRAGDFSMMSTMPTSVVGHFKFSSEKNWDAAADIDGDELLKSTEASEYFTLNLKLLNAGLRSVPFHKRMDYPASMFTKNELAQMEEAAEIAEKDYQFIKSGGTLPLINILKNGSVKSAETAKNEEVNEIANETEKVSLNDEKAAPENSIEPTTTNNEIQDWLDNVLEEGN